MTHAKRPETFLGTIVWSECSDEALFGILNSNGITGILSGVAGYVLGGLNSAKPAAPAPPGT